MQIEHTTNVDKLLLSSDREGRTGRCTQVLSLCSCNLHFKTPSQSNFIHPETQSVRYLIFYVYHHCPSQNPRHPEPARQPLPPTSQFSILLINQTLLLLTPPCCSSVGRSANFSMTFLTSSTSGASTSTTFRRRSNKPLNSSGKMSRSKSNVGEVESARVTASENLAGCAVERTIWTVDGGLNEDGVRCDQ